MRRYPTATSVTSLASSLARYAEKAECTVSTARAVSRSHGAARSPRPAMEEEEEEEEEAPPALLVFLDGERIRAMLWRLGGERGAQIPPGQVAFSVLGLV